MDGTTAVCGLIPWRPHSNHVTAGAELCFLFIEPNAVTLPENCCTLKISPLCRELILTLATRSDGQRAEPQTLRLTQVLFDELPQQPQEQMQLPVSAHPKIRRMVETMAREPAQWQTLGQWAGVFAMSERNLARLVVRETGLSFRRWRHQLQLILALQALVGGTTCSRWHNCWDTTPPRRSSPCLKKARARRRAVIWRD